VVLGPITATEYYTFTSWNSVARQWAAAGQRTLDNETTSQESEPYDGGRFRRDSLLVGLSGAGIAVMLAGFTGTGWLAFQLGRSRAAFVLASLAVAAAALAAPWLLRLWHEIGAYQWTALDSDVYDVPVIAIAFLVGLPVAALLGGWLLQGNARRART